MQMRLAFSVATAVRPDVLIVDEALSVGDAYFQHKSIRRIRSFRDEGTTLLLASHDPGAIKSLCERALLLDGGVVVRDGSADRVLDYYNAVIAKKEKDAELVQQETRDGRTVTRSGNGSARIVSVQMTDEAGDAKRAFEVGDRARIECKVEFHEAVDRPTVGILIRDRLGNDVFGTNTYYLPVESYAMDDGERIAVTFDLTLNLGYGNYSLSVAVHSRDSHVEDNYDWIDQAVVFQMIPNNSHRFVGTAYLPVRAAMHREVSNGRTQRVAASY